MPKPCCLRGNRKIVDLLERKQQVRGITPFKRTLGKKKLEIFILKVKEKNTTIQPTPELLI